MKKSELLFNVISVPVDFLSILFAASLAYFLRYRVETIPVIFDLTYFEYFRLIAIAIPFLLGLFALSGLYTQKSTRGFVREMGKVSLAVSAGLMLVVLLFFFDQHLFPSRLIILMAWGLSIVTVIVGRGLLLLLQRNLLAKGVGLHRLVVIIGENSSPIVDEIEEDSRLGYEIVASLRFGPYALSQIEKMHRAARIDELMQADFNLKNEDILSLVTLCEQLGIKFNYLPSILESHRTNIETDVIGSLPVIRLRPTPLDGWGKVTKRIMDILVAGAGLVLFAPIFLLISLAIRFDTAGPIFFHQRRGSSFHSFEFYKFRSMHNEMSEGTEEGDQIRRQMEERNSRRGPFVKIKHDPRVTRVGRFLRRTKLDELPQFWHVLRGQMSLVGPRIHMISEVEKFEDKYKRIYTIKPGATGLAQINQFYNPELSFADEVKLDLFYVENWSVRLDLYIIAKTLFLLFVRPPKADY